MYVCLYFYFVIMFFSLKLKYFFPVYITIYIEVYGSYIENFNYIHKKKCLKYFRNKSKILFMYNILIIGSACINSCFVLLSYISIFLAVWCFIAWFFALRWLSCFFFRSKLVVLGFMKVACGLKAANLSCFRRI